MTISSTRSTGSPPRGRRRRTALALVAVSAGTLLATMVNGGSASADSTGNLALPFGAPGRYLRLCLDVLAASPANFTPVQIHECNTTGAQKWTEVTAGNTVRALGKCLDVEGGATANGTKIDIYQCNGTGAQVWIHQANGALYNPQSNKCLDDPGHKFTDTQVQIWDCNGTESQNWQHIAA